MNRRIKREWAKLGYKNKPSIPLSKCSPKLFHLIVTSIGRQQDRSTSDLSKLELNNK